MFASVRKKAAAPAPHGATGDKSGLSLVGADMVISGDVASTAQVHVDGRIDGNVRCDTLIQGQSGTIAGHIIADSAHLSGLVDGTVKARVITLEATARITGDVTYETLSIAAGASIEGRLTRREAAPAAVLAAAPATAPASEPATQPTAGEPQPEKKRGRPIRPNEPSLLPALETPAAAVAAG